MLIKFLKKIKSDITNWFFNYLKIIRLESKYNCSISSNSTFTGSVENIKIGKNTRINKLSNFRFKKGSIKDQSMYSKDIFIGDGAWIGAYSIILPGVRVGNGSIIGAHSIVNKNVPDNEIWGGIPAKKLKNR